MKRAFKMKQNVIFLIFKGLSLQQIKQFLLEGESPTLSIFISFLHGFLCVKSLCMEMANDDHQIVLQFLLMHHGSLENEDSTIEFFSKFVKSLVSLSSQTFLRIFYSAIIQFLRKKISENLKSYIYIYIYIYIFVFNQNKSKKQRRKKT